MAAHVVPGVTLLLNVSILLDAYVVLHCFDLLSVSLVGHILSLSCLCCLMSVLCLQLMLLLSCLCCSLYHVFKSHISAGIPAHVYMDQLVVCVSVQPSVSYNTVNSTIYVFTFWIISFFISKITKINKGRDLHHIFGHNKLSQPRIVYIIQYKNKKLWFMN